MKLDIAPSLFKALFFAKALGGGGYDIDWIQIYAISPPVELRYFAPCCNDNSAGYGFNFEQLWLQCYALILWGKSVTSTSKRDLWCITNFINSNETAFSTKFEICSNQGDFSLSEIWLLVMILDLNCENLVFEGWGLFQMTNLDNSKCALSQGRGAVPVEFYGRVLYTATI